MPKRPGRPRNSDDPERSKQDETIARTVWQLLAWGFTLRGKGGVAEEVGLLAKEVLKAEDPYGLAFGERTIEEIFDRWSLTATRPSGWASHRGLQPVGKPWSKTKVDSLRNHRPHVSVPASIQALPERSREIATEMHMLREIARVLLANTGQWSGPLPGDLAPLGDDQLTATGYAGHPKFVRDEGEKNGAENPGE